MKIKDHVLKAIEAFDRNEKDHALMHATFAIEATSRNLFPEAKGKTDYKKWSLYFCNPPTVDDPYRYTPKRSCSSISFNKLTH